MRRLLVIALVLAAGAGAFVVANASAGSQDPDTPHYTVELDNAFGIVNGADVKVAGVRAGRVTGMRVDPRTKHALVDIAIEKAGFGSLRTDAFCETRPQSLIGEYFVDCRPGTAAQRMKPGGTIPVAHTASTIPLDLVNDIMRQPYRDRLRIILDELGAGVGGPAPRPPGHPPRRAGRGRRRPPPRHPGDRAPRGARAALDRPGAGDPRRP